MPNPYFSLNGKVIKFNEISDIADDFISNGTENEFYLGSFIKCWIDDEDFISVNTSGTTSNPKLIRLPKTTFINSAKATAAYFGLVAGDSALCCLPFSFIAGKMMFVRAWVLGLKLDVIEPSSYPLDSLTKKVYDFSAMVPLQLQNSISKINQIKILLVGGANVSDELASKLKEHTTSVFETFGMTETVSHIAAKNLSLGDSFFKVLPEIEISQDERDCLVVSAPFLIPEKLTTNDVVSIFSQNTFKWLGRYDNVINSGGIKIHPEELEKQIGAQLKSRYFISSIKDKKLGEKVVLIIEGKKINIGFDWGEIDSKKQPRSIIFIEKFIETKSGKINRKKTTKLLNLNIT